MPSLSETPYAQQVHLTQDQLRHLLLSDTLTVKERSSGVYSAVGFLRADIRRLLVERYIEFFCDPNNQSIFFQLCPGHSLSECQAVLRRKR